MQSPASSYGPLLGRRADDHRYAHLLPAHWDAVIPQWLQEVRVTSVYPRLPTQDMPSFDYCGFVVGDKQDEAILYGKAAGAAFAPSASAKPAQESSLVSHFSRESSSILVAPLSGSFTTETVRHIDISAGRTHGSQGCLGT